jgi:hypothetical protein
MVVDDGGMKQDFVSIFLENEDALVFEFFVLVFVLVLAMVGYGLGYGLGFGLDCLARAEVGFARAQKFLRRRRRWRKGRKP